MSRRFVRARAVLAALALAAGLGLAAAPSADAASYQYFGAESYNSTSGASVFVQFNAAHSQYLVSIKSNYVNCPVPGGGAHVTWCGTVGNNTSHAQAGANYTAGGRSHYIRMDVYAPGVSGTGALTCGTRGDDTSHFVTFCNGVGQ